MTSIPDIVVALGQDQTWHDCDSRARTAFYDAMATATQDRIGIRIAWQWFLRGWECAQTTHTRERM